VGAYSIPSETGLLIPSDCNTYFWKSLLIALLGGSRLIVARFRSARLMRVFVKAQLGRIVGMFAVRSALSTGAHRFRSSVQAPLFHHCACGVIFRNCACSFGVHGGLPDVNCVDRAERIVSLRKELVLLLSWDHAYAECPPDVDGCLARDMRPLLVR